MDYNAYYAASPGVRGPHDIVFDRAEAAEHEELCFDRRIITGPEKYCIPMGKPTAKSPHAKLCDPSLGARPGVGVNDETL